MATGMLVENADKISRVVRDVGFPILICAIMGVVIYQGAIWIGDTILKPTLTANEKLVAEQVESGKQLRDALKQMADSVQAATLDNRRNSEAIVSMASSLKAIEVNTGVTAKETAELSKIRETLGEHHKLLQEIKSRDGDGK